jgi:hypothetical protein
LATSSPLNAELHHLPPEALVPTWAAWETLIARLIKITGYQLYLAHRRTELGPFVKQLAMIGDRCRNAHPRP